MFALLLIETVFAQPVVYYTPGYDLNPVVFAANTFLLFHQISKAEGRPHKSSTEGIFYLFGLP